MTADANLGDADTGDGPTATTTAPAGSGDDDADSVIEVSGLRMSYEGFEAMRGIDLRIRRGEIFAAVGPNGAQARSADAFTEPTSTFGLRLTQRRLRELKYRPVVRWPFLVVLRRNLNGERMTVKFEPADGGGTRVTINGAVARAKRRWPPILGTGRTRSTAQRCDPSMLGLLSNPFTRRGERALVIGFVVERRELDLALAARYPSHRGDRGRGDDSSPHVARSSAHESSQSEHAACLGSHGRSLRRRRRRATCRRSPSEPRSRAGPRGRGVMGAPVCRPSWLPPSGR